MNAIEPLSRLIKSLAGFTSLFILVFMATGLSAGKVHAAILPPTTILPPIGHQSNTFVDLTGRTVILHGANIMNKNPPFYFPSFYAPDGMGSTIGEDWAKFFAANGFNVARVGILWAGVEPAPGVYNDAYILHIRDMVRMFGRYGVYCILDFHQDAWTGAPIAGLTPATFGGDGFPAWATNYMLNGVPQPNNSDSFPFNVYSSSALQTVWDNFWHNIASPPDAVGIQDRFINMHVHVAQLFKNEPNLLYYGSVNEPVPDIQLWQSLGEPSFLQWIGNASPYTANILSQGSNAIFFNTLMPAFHNRLNAAIHRVDPLHMIGNERTFYEVAGDYFPVVPKPKDNNVVLATSFYGTQNSPQSAIDHAQSPAIAKANDMGFMAQEWGSLLEGDGTVSANLPVVRYLDQNKLSWAYWDFAQFPLTMPLQNQNFDSGNSIEGWHPLISPSNIAWSGTIGNPGGSMAVTFTSDPPNQPNGVQIGLPFTVGDLSAPGRTISMDVMVNPASVDICGQPNPCFSTYMILVTNNGPSYDFVAQLQGSLIADGQWHHFTGALLPDGGSPLNDVKQLTLGFFGTPSGSEQVYIDNIQITGDPFQLPVTQDLIYDTSTAPMGNVVNAATLSTMVEPYPRVVAGTPTSYQFDPTTKTFAMSYSRNGANGKVSPPLLPTEIFVPAGVYPNGYNLQVNGGYAISPPNASVLLILRNPSSSNVDVSITSK